MTSQILSLDKAIKKKLKRLKCITKRPFCVLTQRLLRLGDSSVDQVPAVQRPEFRCPAPVQEAGRAGAHLQPHCCETDASRSHKGLARQCRLRGELQVQGGTLSQQLTQKATDEDINTGLCSTHTLAKDILRLSTTDK